MASLAQHQEDQDAEHRASPVEWKYGSMADSPLATIVFRGPRGEIRAADCTSGNIPLKYHAATDQIIDTLVRTMSTVSEEPEEPEVKEQPQPVIDPCGRVIELLESLTGDSWSAEQMAQAKMLVQQSEEVRSVFYEKSCLTKQLHLRRPAEEVIPDLVMAILEMRDVGAVGPWLGIAWVVSIFQYASICWEPLAGRLVEELGKGISHGSSWAEAMKPELDAAIASSKLVCRIMLDLQSELKLASPMPFFTAMAKELGRLEDRTQARLALCPALRMKDPKPKKVAPRTTRSLMKKAHAIFGTSGPPPEMVTAGHSAADDEPDQACISFIYV